VKKISSDIKGFLLLSGVFLLAAILDIMAVYLYYDHVKSFIDNQPEIINADAGVVFFGDYQDEGKALGTDSKNRADKAVFLYHERKIKKIICVGGYEYGHWKGKPHLMRMYLADKGIPYHDIIYDSLSFNTITNWQEAKKIINRNKYKSIVVISAPLHIYRIASMIKSPNTYFVSYPYQLQGIVDYWVFYKDVHHEFVSQLLNVVLKDEIRNRIVYFYHIIMNRLDDIF
jgi:uncharacterized SAM-binding protein YcdF (DUF218 family)